LKLFTQNIDCLEREAGVPGDMIIEAHGSFATQRCIDCKTSFPDDLMRTAVLTNTVPHCLDTTCNGLVKPDIVFFGEQLPASFFEARDLPIDADLAIVMGTSLSVHPFASLPGFCKDRTPRLLINSEQVGDMGSRADDVLMLEDCDSGVRKLAEACGWLEELEALWAETARPEDPEPEEKPKKNRDELLQEEIDKLTKDVESTLNMGKSQHEWLEKHVDRKIARKRDDDDQEEKGENLRPPDDKESKVMAPIKKDEGEGLGHVFPHLKKAAL
jgi:NAD-dependent histone deacetylase SIR2